MRVSEIRVKRIRVNQGLGVLLAESENELHYIHTTTSFLIIALQINACANCLLFF